MRVAKSAISGRIEPETSNLRKCPKRSYPKANTVTERRSHLLLVGLIVAALVAAAMLAVPGSPFHKGATLGLDLQGGTEVVLKAVPPKGEKVTSDGMDTAQSVMRRRVDKLGVTEPEIRKQGNDQMVDRARRGQPRARPGVIGKTAKLELYDLQGDLVPAPPTPRGTRLR